MIPYMTSHVVKFLVCSSCSILETKNYSFKCCVEQKEKHAHGKFHLIVSSLIYIAYLFSVEYWGFILEYIKFTNNCLSVTLFDIRYLEVLGSSLTITVFMHQVYVICISYWRTWFYASTHVNGSLTWGSVSRAWCIYCVNSFNSLNF